MNIGIKHKITVFQSVAVIVGIVIGAGIFRTPPFVAAYTGSAGMFMGVWLLGGIISFIGALCYAELTTAYPHEGGDYIYLRRAYGPLVSFLFVWSRMAIIQTGSIALLGFIIGDYATTIVPIGAWSESFYAILAVMALTILNVSGVHRGFRTQTVLLMLVFACLATVAVTGIVLAGHEPAEMVSVSSPIQTNIGSALIFVLLTFGGWTEAAFISYELKHDHRAMIRSLVLSIGIITSVYLVTNYAYLRSFGIEGLVSSEAVGADLMAKVFGHTGSTIFSLIIIVIALSTMNGVMITGARSNYALGRDYRVFAIIGRLSGNEGNPSAAFLVQGCIALVLIGMGAYARNGFELMVDYTAPVFWLFILLTGISLFILRIRELSHPRPFTVPWYPVTPLLFCLSAAYMLYSGATYAGIGGIAGVIVLAIGIVVFLVRPLENSIEAITEDNI